MRLLFAEKSSNALDAGLKISMREFIGKQIPSYLILSHRWREEEVQYADIMKPELPIHMKGFAKIVAACKIALSKGLEYVWVDTCCIDKSSSSDLSEAINSMYQYYEESSLCVAYLDDHESKILHEREFAASEWFCRGWTLQELLAPQRLDFYTKTWDRLGSRVELSDLTSTVTGIDKDMLSLEWGQRESLKNICISKKFSWAARRETTRPEDMAYCLMGLFDVNMPPIYGEGESKAFRRLQLEIMRENDDHTLFAWESSSQSQGMLAWSVKCFANGAKYQPNANALVASMLKYPATSDTDRVPVPKLDHNMTNAGLHIQLLMSDVPIFPKLFLAYLACQVVSSPESLVAIYLRAESVKDSIQYDRIVFCGQSLVDIPVHRQGSRGLLLRHSDPMWIRSRTYTSTASLGPIRWDIVIKSQSKLTLFFEPSSTSIRQLGSQLPHSDIFEKSTYQIRHWLYGEVSAKFRSPKIVVLGHMKPIIAFGVLEDEIWVYVGESDKHFSASEVTAEQTSPFPQRLIDAFTFPGGDIWAKQAIHDRIFKLDWKSGQTRGTTYIGGFNIEVCLIRNTSDTEIALYSMAILVVQDRQTRFPFLKKK